MLALVAITLSLLVGSVGSVLANSKGWDVSSYPNEARSPAIGCSVGTDDDIWTCLVVRCEDNGTLGLYYEYTDGGGGTDKPFSLMIDGEKFLVNPESAGEGIAFPTRLTGDVTSIVNKLKTGNQVKLVDMTPPLHPGFDTIPLRSSSRAIGKVEAICTPARGVQISESDLLRNASGRVSVDNLHTTPGCAFREATGTVETVQHDGPNGSIDGMMFLDDTYGSGFIRIPALEAGPDLQARRATVDYLLTVGRRLSIGVHGCGAAGRMEKLVSAVEA